MDLNSDDISRKLLESFHFNVEKILESDKPEADFLVTFEECKDIALIEAKLITNDKEEIAKKDKILENGDTYSLDAKLGINNKISKITSKAKNQLSSSDKEHTYKLILYVVSDINPSTTTDQIIDTLYGRTRILITSKNQTKDCYYYSISKFYSYKDTLDGAIIAEQDLINKDKYNVCLFLNSLSNNFDKIKSSCLLTPFNNDIFNPIEKEENGEIFILDTNISGTISELGKMIENSNYNEKIQHIKEKYKLNGLLVKVDYNSPIIIAEV